jgi:hypothetical protein
MTNNSNVQLHFGLLRTKNYSDFIDIDIALAREFAKYVAVLFCE